MPFSFKTSKNDPFLSKSKSDLMFSKTPKSDLMFFSFFILGLPFLFHNPKNYFFPNQLHTFDLFRDRNEKSQSRMTGLILTNPLTPKEFIYA